MNNEDLERQVLPQHNGHLAVHTVAGGNGEV
jgi:hypothetical protein